MPTLENRIGQLQSLQKDDGGTYGIVRINTLLGVRGGFECSGLTFDEAKQVVDESQENGVVFVWMPDCQWRQRCDISDLAIRVLSMSALRKEA